MLVALIDLTTLIGLYEEERMRPNGAIVLLRRDGVVVARAPHDERLLGKSLVGGQLFREYLPRREAVSPSSTGPRPTPWKNTSAIR